MFRLTGNEKAFLGGLVAFLTTSIVQLSQQPAGYTWHEFLWSVVSWVVVHISVYFTTNTPTPPMAA
jgi:hypothetical protein